MSHLADGPTDWAEHAQPRCFEGSQELQVAELHRGDTKDMACQKQSVELLSPVTPSHHLSQQVNSKARACLLLDFGGKCTW